MNVSRILELVMILSLLATSALAGHGHNHCCCPDCGSKICVPEAITIKEKKHCFDFECKDICIPGIKGPCVPCCEPPVCGRVRTVKVLKKTEYECERCGYKWNVHKACEQAK